MTFGRQVQKEMADREVLVILAGGRAFLCRAQCTVRQSSTMADVEAAFNEAANNAANGLAAYAGADSDDEVDETPDFGAGAIDPGRRRGDGVPLVGALAFDAEAAERVAQRASSRNAASFAMKEGSWVAADRVASRFIRFLAAAYADVDAPDGVSVEQQGERMAITLDGTLPHRLCRFFSLLREGGRGHLVGGRNAPLSMGTICNFASSLGHFYALATRDFAGQVPYVPGCSARDQLYEPIVGTARTPAQVLAGVTHAGCPLKDPNVVQWLSGSVKRATSLGEGAAQTPPVTTEAMIAACAMATAGFQEGGGMSALMHERLCLYVIMAFSWCTMLRPDNLLGLLCRDVIFAPMVGENLTFFQEHGRPRWVKVRYTKLKTNVAGTAPTPAYYFWSALASDEEMRASSLYATADVCVRCPWHWCDLPFFAFVYAEMRAEDPGYLASSALPFFVTSVAGGNDDDGVMSNDPVTKVWWEQHLRAFVLAFDPALSARGVGGLYGFRRGATQFWLAHTGDVEMVMKMGVWKPNSTRFLFYVLNFRCRGTFRARIRNCYRLDRHGLMTRLEGLVDEFMVWFEGRVTGLLAENHGNFFAAGFGVEVAGKVMDMIDTLLRTHGGLHIADAP